MDGASESGCPLSTVEGGGAFLGEAIARSVVIGSDGGAATAAVSASAAGAKIEGTAAAGAT
ncbi:MAG: hypothetical protein HC838_06305 [Spirulinaceae cyanobacterium RM2_2_10]|nr:hypothetical protein [Spirulinaceae cyanobacterium RM2_2_10]